jgi:hypothetical protein
LRGMDGREVRLDAWGSATYLQANWVYFASASSLALFTDVASSGMFASYLRFLKQIIS